jgi:hypothetical protein
MVGVSTGLVYLLIPGLLPTMAEVFNNPSDIDE